MEVESNDAFLFPWFAYEEFRGTKIYVTFLQRITIPLPDNIPSPLIH